MSRQINKFISQITKYFPKFLSKLVPKIFLLFLMKLAPSFNRAFIKKGLSANLNFYRKTE